MTFDIYDIINNDHFWDWVYDNHWDCVPYYNDWVSNLENEQQELFDLYQDYLNEVGE